MSFIDSEGVGSKDPGRDGLLRSTAADAPSVLTQSVRLSVDAMVGSKLGSKTSNLKIFERMNHFCQDLVPRPIGSYKI